MKVKVHPWVSVILISVLPVFALWLPFALHLQDLLFLHIPEPGMLNILRNWDGPHYIVVAQTWYNIPAVEKLLFTNVPASYYPAHFPLYPLFIALIAPLFGFFYSGLFVNLLFGILLNILFYTIAREYTKHPLWLTFVFTVFPGRFLVTRAILAPETLMVLCMLGSLYLWERKAYMTSSIAVSLGILSKIKAIFLLPAYAAASVEEMLLKKIGWDIRQGWIFLAPLTLIGLFSFYAYQTGDFLAFLHAEQENQLFMTFPFAQFNAAATWIGTAWIEDVVFYFAGMFMLITALAQQKKNRSWFYFALFYSLFLVFVPQRDITRFSYPLYPLFLLTFQKYMTSKAWKISLILLLPAVYFYALNFMLQNQAPIANYAAFL